MLDANAPQYAHERLEHLCQRNELRVSSEVVRLGSSSDVLDQSGQELADAKLDDPRSSSGGDEERGEAVEGGGGGLTRGASARYYERGKNDEPRHRLRERFG